MKDIKDISNDPVGGSVLFPKCNREATHVEDVYKIEDIFKSADVLDSLTEAAESVMNDTPVEPSTE